MSRNRIGCAKHVRARKQIRWSRVKCVIMIQDIKRNIQEQIGYVGLIIALIAFFSYYLYLTFGYTQRETWFFPRIIIVLGLSFVIIDLFTVAFRERVNQFFDSGEESVLDQASTGTGEEESIEPKSYVLSLIKEVGWLIGYIVGVYYIGFFTTTFSYTTLYVLAHREKRTPKTAVIAVSIGLGVVVFLWLLFVELMNSAAVFRLGYFP